MRIRSIGIKNWRHFSDIHLQLQKDTGLVCIVGANGTGKSHILELIGACAHRVGLSQGVEIPRGDPFADVHELHLQFHVASDVSETVEQFVSSIEDFRAWDHTLLLHSKRSDTETFCRITAGGVAPDKSETLTSNVVDRFRDSKDVHFLSLDADRAYPPKKHQY
ncbi:MAG: AAA family ATPase [Planctomycetes bacterium]|nr:AAA family ATPase [Planctomycetota bacterium]